jgi:hypothetical protein
VVGAAGGAAAFLVSSRPLAAVAATRAPLEQILGAVKGLLLL